MTRVRMQRYDWKSLLWYGLPLVVFAMTYLVLRPGSSDPQSPPRYTQEEIASQVVDALQLYLETSDGRFPDVEYFQGDALMRKVQRDLRLPDFSGDSARWGFSHLTTLQRTDPTFRYRGRGRVLGDGSRIILNWSVSDGRHQIIMDNLEQRIVDSLELSSLLSSWNTLANQCVVRVNNGSGTVVSSYGLILTANHVVDSKSNDNKVVFADGTAYSAKMVSRDQRLDAALLTLEAAPTVAFVPIQPVTPVESQRLWVLGYPGGRISPLIREVVLKRHVLHELITESDVVQVSGGDSGGAIINDDGELVGIIIGPASAKLTQVRATDAQSLVAAFPELRSQ